MYQQDYILRLIERVGVMLRRLVSELREARPEEAIATSREALSEATGLSPALAETLTAEALVSMLGTGGGFEAKRGLLVGEVLVRRAEAFEAGGDPQRAASERHRALVVLTEVGRTGSAEDATAAALLVDEMTG